jgi:hypothetical protein
MSDPDEEQEREFASPPCSLSELDPEFAGLAPREGQKRKKAKREAGRPDTR